jgi:ATP synthase protein I
LVAAALSLLLGLVSAYSALLGGLVCVVPNAFLAARFIGALKIERSRVFKRLIVSEVLKLVITGVFFALVFIYVDPLNTLIFFASFIGVQAIHWLSPLILKTG